MTYRLNPAAIAAAIGENLREYSLLAGLVPGGRSSADGDVVWIDTGTAAMNRVMGAHFSPENAAARINETAALFGGRPLTWITSPADRPADLGRLLLGQGFRHLMTWRGMALVLDGPPPAVAAPAGLEIRRAAGPEDLMTWGRTAARGFAMGEKIGRDFPGVIAALATDSVACFLGSLDGRPAATASVFLGSTAAGAYFISTLGPARLRGVASAMTAALIGHARSRGCRLLVLEASPGGYEVYRRLNFAEYCRMETYTLNT